MSDSQDEQQGVPEEKETTPLDSQKVIRKNLNSFLNPGLPMPPARPADPSGALHLRMAQMELANRMRLERQTQEGGQPSPPPTMPSGGFGSAQGVFHMRAANFGQKKPAASKPSPYQQVFAAASQPPEETSPTEASPAGSGNEVLEVPKEAEVKQNQPPKRLRGKKFRNPTL